MVAGYHLHLELLALCCFDEVCGDLVVQARDLIAFADQFLYFAMITVVTAVNQEQLPVVVAGPIANYYSHCVAYFMLRALTLSALDAVDPFYAQ